MDAWPEGDWLASWAEAVVGAPLGDDVSGRIGLVVGATPSGDVGGVLVVDGGTVTAWEPGPTGAADVVLTVPVVEARQLLDGTVAPSVAFMRGRLKVALGGDDSRAMRLVLAVLASTASDSYQTSRRKLAERS